jgi:GT2 family glycosyltransferase
MPPRVSVIIVTWNAKELLQRCLPSVVATRYENLEIVIADNHSTDGSAEWVEDTYGPTVELVRHPENWAFCRGNNAAVPHTTGDYLVLLNNDVEVPENWLDPLVRRMESNREIGAVQPKLLQYDNRKRFEYAGASGGFIDRYGYPFTRGRLFDTMENDHGQYDDNAQVFWASGAALMLRREAFTTVGRLDETFVLHMEEIDLCWRLARHDYTVEVVPDSEVYHIGGSSLPRENPEKTYYNFRNSLLMLYKNLSPADWRRTLPGRLLLDVLAFGYLIAQGKVRQGLAIVRGYRDAVDLFARYTDERPGEKTPGSTVLPPYRGSIVVDYFLRGRRTFRELPPAKFRPPYPPPSSPPSGESQS